jgi:hypothetical protein
VTTRPSRWRGIAAIAGALLLLSACGDDEQTVTAAERDAAIYSTVLRDMVLAEIPPADPAEDGSDSLPILYVTGADGESIAVDVQAEVVKNLKDEAEVRFVDAREDALVTDEEDDESGDDDGSGTRSGAGTSASTAGEEPVQDDGVLTTFGPLPDEGTTVDVDVEIYRDSTDNQAYVVTLAGSRTQWVIRSMEPVG